MDKVWNALLPLILCFAILLSGGCEQPRPHRLVRLPPPPAEVPVANIPPTLRVKNWPGPQGQGSCVHASLKNMMMWLNRPDWARQWPHSDGEYASRLRERLDQAGYRYAWTDKTDLRFLRWCHDHRLSALMWWKPNHCCLFVGFARGSEILAVNPEMRGKVDPDKMYAGILDNNYIERYEFTEVEQFGRLWFGYGGFGLALLYSPASPLPYEMFRVVQ